MAAAARSGGGLHSILSSLAELTKFGVDAVDQPRYLLLAHYRIRGAASVASGSSAPQEKTAAAAATTTSLRADHLTFLPSTALMVLAPQVAPTLHRKICGVPIIDGAAPALAEVGIPLQPPHRQIFTHSISTSGTLCRQIYGVSMLTGAPCTASSVQGAASLPTDPHFVRFSFNTSSASRVRTVPGFPHTRPFSRRPSGREVQTVPCFSSVHSRPYSTGSLGGENPECKYNEVILNRLDKVERVGRVNIISRRPSGGEVRTVPPVLRFGSLHGHRYSFFGR